MSVVPEAYAVAIEINDVDVTEFCPYDKMDLDDLLSDVSSFNFTMQNPDTPPVEHDFIFVYAPNLISLETIFSGYVIEVREIRRGVVSDYEVECADKKIRLQKSVVAPKIYNGIDTDIIDELLLDTEPDLSDVYDFSIANSISDILQNLPANDDSLLDMLKDLADKTGASMRFERPGKSFRLAFDGEDNLDRDQTGLSGRSWRSQVGDSEGSIIVTDDIVVGDGVDGTNAYKWSGTHFDADDFVALLFENPKGTYFNMTFDLKFDLNGRDLKVIAPSFVENFVIDSSQEGQWITVDVSAELPDISAVVNGGTSFLGFSPVSTFTDTFNIWVDNIRIEFVGSTVKDELVWDSSPDNADWDLDVQLSDEYGSNIDFSIGGFDDFNSVIVTGGKTAYEIDEIISADGQSKFFQAPAPISDYTISINTDNEDISPVWTAQDVGLWGEDELGVGGIDVLYDPNTLFLLFNTAPPNLVKAIRIEATIYKPFRLRLDDTASADEPIFIKTIEDDTISSEEEAIAIGAAELNKRNAMRRLEFDTHNPGLKVGQNINAIDSSRSMDETIRINSIRVTWLGASGHAAFHVTCGEDEEAGLGGLVADTDKRSRKKENLLIATTTLVDVLIDEDGVPLVDEDGTAFEDD